MPWFGFPYRQHPYDGFWGEQNSHAQFCEESYILTPVAAELINTLTNLTYVIYGCYGIISNGSRKDAFLRDLPYVGLLCVGIGSTMFHATLKYYTQWCDDLSMLLAVALVMHRVYTANTSIRTTILAGLGLSAVLGGFAVWHCITDDIGWHNLIFGIMICLVGIKTHAVIDSRVDDPLVRREVVKMSIVGGTIFVSGFAIWNLDNFFCNGLTHAKRGIGMPWSFLLELHGYWHIFTGIGAYIFMALVEYLTSEEAGEPLGGRFAWPVPWIVDGSASTGREREALLPTASDAAADTSGGADALVLKINQD